MTAAEWRVLSDLIDIRLRREAARAECVTLENIPSGGRLNEHAAMVAHQRRLLEVLDAASARLIAEAP